MRFLLQWCIQNIYKAKQEMHDNAYKKAYPSKKRWNYVGQKQMNYRKQDDYEQFKCVGGKCPSSCCKGWEIVIDESSIENYVNYTGAFKNRLTEGIDFAEGVFLQCDGRCSMLNKDDLCDLQIHMGEDALCNTCYDFPRHMEEFDSVREFSLSLSCPEAAKMLLERVDALHYISWETEEEEEFAQDYDDFDYMLYSALMDCREYIEQKVIGKKGCLGRSLEEIINIAKELEFALEDGVYDSIDALKRSGKGWSYEEAKREFELLFELERLSDDWDEILQKTDAFFFTEKAAAFENLKEILYAEDTAEKVSWQMPLSNITRQLLFTYLCGAVYDGLVMAKAALCVNFTRWVAMIAFALGNGKMEMENLLFATYRLAKEIEHSDENLCAIDAFFTC